MNSSSSTTASPSDASVIAVAERHGARRIATLDRPHFAVVQPKHTDYFTLLPDLA
ncbi:hypothetical protein [Streptomyces fructofermentans]|uniref:hypothetical protein n=1 Tax=Streptomyces fructofermentans TaxID=152141 RepID=UPI0037AF15E3